MTHEAFRTSVHNAFPRVRFDFSPDDGPLPFVATAPRLTVALRENQNPFSRGTYWSVEVWVGGIDPVTGSGMHLSSAESSAAALLFDAMVNQ